MVHCLASLSLCHLFRFVSFRENPIRFFSVISFPVLENFVPKNGNVDYGSFHDLYVLFYLRDYFCNTGSNLCAIYSHLINTRLTFGWLLFVGTTLAISIRGVEWFFHYKQEKKKKTDRLKDCLEYQKRNTEFFILINHKAKKERKYWMNRKMSQEFLPETW